MKVFLSWSGEQSHKLACAFRDWLPSVLQYVIPYVSSEDIDKGARWSTDIAKELELSSFGILLITHQNLLAPWINFEAGALSKTVEKARVCPFLFGVRRSEVHGPLLQFQSVTFEKGDVEKLLGSMNDASGEGERLDDVRLKKVFDVRWPQLDGALRDVGEHAPGDTPVPDTPASPSGPILEELLDLVRNQMKLLRSPQDLLPAEYVRGLISPALADRVPALADRVDAEALEYLVRRFAYVRASLNRKREQSPMLTQELSEEFWAAVDTVNKTIEHIAVRTLGPERAKAAARKF